MSSLTQKISKVFVIHYKKLTNRKEYLINYFKSKNITNYEFRNNFQREDLTTDIVNHYFKSNKFERENLSTKAAESYFKLNNFDNVTTDIADFYFKLNILNSAQICITIEHIETYKEIVNRTSDNDDSWYLILEDDAMFFENFVNDINLYLDNVPQDAEYLDISDYFTIRSQNMWERKDSTRTNCGYLIKRSTCVKLLSTIVPFEYPIDHELNKQLKMHNIKTYWSNKSLIHHGSGTHYHGSYTH